MFWCMCVQVCDCIMQRLHDQCVVMLAQVGVLHMYVCACVCVCVCMCVRACVCGRGDGVEGDAGVASCVKLSSAD
jgi:hypothetical protein